MTSSRWAAGDIMGLTPGLDLRKSDKLFAVGGKNFAFDSLGPKSVFGDRLVLPHKLGLPAHIQGVKIPLRTTDRTFTFQAEGILEWSESIGGWKILYVTQITNISPYRWTYGYLNGKVYFCHPVTGILVYDLDLEIVYKHNGPGVPSAPLAICINMGRLIALDDTYVFWSWQSDGLNFTPSLSEAGFQKVNDRVAGFPIMVANYAQGFITWTSGGMMRSEFTGDQEVYRHRNLNTEFKPVNSFCTVQMDDNSCMILDKRGLMVSTGGAPEVTTPMFNEFLINYIRQNKLELGQNVRLEWDPDRRFLYVMLSITPNLDKYERAFVLYPPLDKWGTFNEDCYGILPIRINGTQRGGLYFGYVDVEGRIRYWSDFPSREILPEGGSLNLRYPLIQKNLHTAVGGGYQISSSSFIMNSEPQTTMTYPAGYYANESNTPATPEVRGLDAKIQVGLIRFPELSDSFDHMTEIIGVMLGNQLSGPEVQDGEDYLTIPDGVDDEDYEVVTGAEDYGEDSLAYVNHGIRVISTIDGRSVYQDAVPLLIQFVEGVRHFSCSTVGIWHILEVTADSPGEAFHIRAFELNAVDAGRFS